MATKTEKPAQALPHDAITERAVLGAVIADNRLYSEIEWLKPEHFYTPLHVKTYRIIARCIDVGALADTNTIRHLFNKERDLEIFDGVNGQSVGEYLSTIDQHAAPRSKIRDYARTIEDLATRRAMVVIAEDLASAAYDAPHAAQPEVYIEQAEADLYKLKRQGVGARDVIHLCEAMQDALDATEAAYTRGAGLNGLSTGIAAIDAAIGGLAPSGLYVVGGRPGMGKTTLGVNIALNVATSDEPVPVGILSLEMSGMEIGARILAERSGVPSWALRKGDVRSDEQWRKLFETVKGHSDVPFYIDPTGGLTTSQMVMRARRLARQHGIGLLVLDYIGLVRGDNARNGNRVQEVSETTAALKMLAKELNIPVIALSQLNRGVESRENKRPMQSDLRESGSIEQDADVIAFVFRENYYVEREKPDESNAAAMIAWEDAMRRTEGKAELIIAKNRHGPTSTAELQFDADAIRFS